MEPIYIADYNYPLPDERIAKYPPTFNPVNADANGDGAINVIDVQAIIYIIQTNLN